MVKAICDTSPLQYLHQLGQLELLYELCGSVIVPVAVVDELRAGKQRGIDLPSPEDVEWMLIQKPTHAAVLPLVNDLGRGETEVLALALELTEAVAILDDGYARQVAESLNIKIMGTLGVLMDAKNKGFLEKIEPLLTRLDVLGFRLNKRIRKFILDAVDEQSH